MVDTVLIMVRYSFGANSVSKVQHSREPCQLTFITADPINSKAARCVETSDNQRKTQMASLAANDGALARAVARRGERRIHATAWRRSSAIRQVVTTQTYTYWFDDRPLSLSTPACPALQGGRLP